jgi:hypothetical protein
MDGACTIRVFRKVESFIQKYNDVVDVNTSALLNFVTAQRWLGLRIELLGTIMVLVCSVLVVTMNDVLLLDPGLGTLDCCVTMIPLTKISHNDLL